MPLCGIGGSATEHDPSTSQPDSGRRPLQRKIVVIGDGACGKTSLLNVRVYGVFPYAYEPTVFENHVMDMVVDGQPVEMSLWDTAGQEDFDKLRRLSYADTHVVMLCFSVDLPDSLDNVESKWVEEIVTHVPGVKLCLVACKCDLREDPNVKRKLADWNQKPVQYEEGLAVARRIRASRYLECSAKFDRGVREAFEEAARVAVGAQRKGETRGSRPMLGEAGSKDKGCTIC